MKKGCFFLLLLLLNFSLISSAVMHPASDFKISVAGSSMTLQQAADGGYLKGESSYASSSSILMGQHDASQIWVSVNGAEKTLLAALSFGVNGLCGSSSSSYSSASIPNPSHLATEINLSSGKSLQAAIDESSFCQCVPGTTQTKDCDYLDSVCRNYNDVTQTCSSSGAWDNPSCDSFSNAARATPCGGDDWHACDGSGNCQGWSGTGCGGCPWSYKTLGDVRKVCILNGNRGTANIGGWGAWTYEEDHAAICATSICCLEIFWICWDYCWAGENSYQWAIKP